MITTQTTTTNNSVDIVKTLPTIDPAILSGGLVPANFKCTQVAILGRPNAGKSTLMNALIEVALSAVSKRPQTTRTSIRGVIQLYNKKKEWNGQVVLVDTPGVNFKKGMLDRAMHMSIENSLGGVDTIIWAADCRTFQRDLRDIEMGRPGADKMAAFLKDRLQKETHAKWILVLTKADLVSKNDLLPLIQRAATLLPEFVQIVPVASALGMANKNSNLESLLKIIFDASPVSAPIFSEDDFTDLNDRQLIQNLIREAIFTQTAEEVPYMSDCTILQYIDADGKTKRMNEVDATIWVAKDSIKPILVGAHGSRIKEIGMAVRARYKEITGDDIVLRLFVKVVEKWDSRASNLAELGYVLE